MNNPSRPGKRPGFLHDLSLNYLSVLLLLIMLLYVEMHGNVTSQKKKGAKNTMKKTIIKKNLSIEDAKNVAEELRLYGYRVEITVEGNRRTVTATREAQK